MGTIVREEATVVVERVTPVPQFEADTPVPGTPTVDPLPWWRRVPQPGRTWARHRQN